MLERVVQLTTTPTCFIVMVLCAVWVWWHIAPRHRTRFHVSRASSMSRQVPPCVGAEREVAVKDAHNPGHPEADVRWVITFSSLEALLAFAASERDQSGADLLLDMSTNPPELTIVDGCIQ